MVSINDAKCYKSPKARDYLSDWGEAGKASFVHVLIHSLLVSHFVDHLYEALYQLLRIER